jgi:hypothetical protein
MSELRVMQGDRWIAPAFSRYGPAMGWVLTEWIYGDPAANPRAGEPPSTWKSVGRIRVVERTLTYDDLAAAGSTTQLFDPSGGKNCVVLYRNAVLKSATPATIDPNLADIQIQRTDGFITMEQTPIGNCFGTGTEPFILPSPDPWVGNERHNVTVTNDSGVTLDVEVVFGIAVLDTGYIGSFVRP